MLTLSFAIIENYLTALKDDQQPLISPDSYVIYATLLHK